jgi:hypothetical protein
MMGSAQALAVKHGVDAALAADPDVDAVHIAWPHSHHHEHASLMPMAGKHLLEEKPFTMHTAQAHGLIALQNAAGYVSTAGGFVAGVGGMSGSGVPLIGDKVWLAVTDHLFNPGRALFSTQAGVEELTDTGREARDVWGIRTVQACLADGLRESSSVPHDLTLGVMQLLDHMLIQIRGRVLT